MLDYLACGFTGSEPIPQIEPLFFQALTIFISHYWIKAKDFSEKISTIVKKQKVNARILIESHLMAS